MIPRKHGEYSNGAGIAAWKELDHGTSTICAFAELCRLAIVMPPTEPVLIEQLSREAQTILSSASRRGAVDIRGSKDEFDSVDRFLAVCVETELDRRLLFRRKDNPEKTVEFLSAFAELCRHGLVLHHLGRDFSFSASGFKLAKSIDGDSLNDLLEFGVELDH